MERSTTNRGKKKPGRKWTKAEELGSEHRKHWGRQPGLWVTGKRERKKETSRNPYRRQNPRGDGLSTVEGA